MIRRWNKSKPPRGPWAFNRDCPQAQGMIAYWPLADVGFPVLDYVGKYHLPGGLAPPSATGSDGQPLRNFTAATQHQMNTSTGILPALVAPWSMLCRHKPSSLAGTTGIFTVGDATLSVHLSFIRVNITDGVVSLYTDGLGGAGQASGGAVAVGKESCLIGVETSIASRNIWVDGVAGTANTTSTVPANLDFPVIGAYYETFTFSNWAAGEIGETALYNIALTAQIIDRLNNKGLKYEMMYPLRSTKWISVPAAAGGFKPYWVIQRSRVIGAGVH